MMLTKKLEPSWKQRGSLQSGIHDIKAPHIPILKWKTTLVLSNVQRISCLVEINQKLFISPRPQGISPALIQKQKPESPRLKKTIDHYFFSGATRAVGCHVLARAACKHESRPLKTAFQKTHGVKNARNVKATVISSYKTTGESEIDNLNTPCVPWESDFIYISYIIYHLTILIFLFLVVFLWGLFGIFFAIWKVAETLATFRNLSVNNWFVKTHRYI